MANDLGAQVFNAQEQSGMQTASNEGLPLNFVQISAGDTAAETHGREFTETMNAVKNMKNQTSKLSRNMVRQKKCLILITITFAIILLGMGMATVYMLTKNQETQPIGNVGLGNKTLANLVQYIDEQREEITQLELRIRKGEVNSRNKRLEEHGIIEDVLKKVNNTALEQLQIGKNELKSIQKYLIKDAVMEAGENYTIVDGKLFWTGSASRLTYDVAYSVCAKYWSTVAQIKNRREFDSVTSMLRSKTENLIDVWIGLEMNPLTGQISPTNGFTKWDDGEPEIGRGFENYTNVALAVHPGSTSDDHGMMTTFPPRYIANKVLCQLWEKK